MNARSSIFLLALLASVEAEASQTLETHYQTAGSGLHQSFEPVRQVLQSSSAVIRQGRREIIFGTVVSAEGHILTKASELAGMEGLTVTVDEQTHADPVLLAENPVWDVALIKIDAEGLTPVRFTGLAELPQGSWLVANGATTRTQRRVQIGVASANAREVPASGGTVLGVQLTEDSSELRVGEVVAGSGAEAAGLEVDDLLVALDGVALVDREGVSNLLENRRVGERVKLQVKRGGDFLDLEIELAGRADLFGEEQSRNDAMSGEYSERRTGFPRVIQHDIMGNRHYMGGPVLNLDGECVGMNIARFSRCETYAIPALELEALAKEMIAASAK